MTTVTATGVFEQMPDHAANARWAELDDLLEPDFEIVDPALLPYGGVHRGVDAYVELTQTITRSSSCASSRDDSSRWATEPPLSHG